MRSGDLMVLGALEGEPVGIPARSLAVGSWSLSVVNLPTLLEIGRRLEEFLVGTGDCDL